MIIAWRWNIIILSFILTTHSHSLLHSTNQLPAFVWMVHSCIWCDVFGHFVIIWQSNEGSWRLGAYEAVAGVGWVIAWRWNIIIPGSILATHSNFLLQVANASSFIRLVPSNLLTKFRVISFISRDFITSFLCSGWDKRWWASCFSQVESLIGVI